MSGGRDARIETQAPRVTQDAPDGSGTGSESSETRSALPVASSEQQTACSVFEIPEPHFGPCSSCGQLTAGGGRCFDCNQRAEARAKATEATRDAIPQDLRWARFEARELAQRVSEAWAIDRAKSAIAAPRVVLCGRAMAGKTVLAVAMMRAWSAHTGREALFAFAGDLASARMRARLGREATEVIDAMAAPLLVLDDLGTDRDLPSSAVVEVLWKRHAEGRPTYVTTWMSAASIGSRYGAGVARRVFDGARVIDLGGSL